MFFCFLLLISRLVTSSPIVSVIHKGQPSPVLLCSGVIATEKYIFVTKYPISTYVTSFLCVMPATNLQTVSEEHRTKYCKDIKQVHFLKDTDFGIVELKTTIFFYYQVSTAMIPESDNFDLDLTQQCYVIYNNRSKDLGQYQHVVAQAVELGRISAQNNSTYYLEVVLNKAHLFCVNDNGLPMFYDFAVVGLFSYASEKCMKESEQMATCLLECSSLKQLRIVRTFGGDIHDFIKKFIGVEDY